MALRSCEWTGLFKPWAERIYFFVIWNIWMGFLFRILGTFNHNTHSKKRGGFFGGPPRRICAGGKFSKFPTFHLSLKIFHGAFYLPKMRKFPNGERETPHVFFSWGKSPFDFFLIFLFFHQKRYKPPNITIFFERKNRRAAKTDRFSTIKAWKITKHNPGGFCLTQYPIYFFL